MRVLLLQISSLCDTATLQIQHHIAWPGKIHPMNFHNPLALGLLSVLSLELITYFSMFSPRWLSDIASALKVCFLSLEIFCARVLPVSLLDAHNAFCRWLQVYCSTDALSSL